MQAAGDVGGPDVRCHACAEASLTVFSDLGEFPVDCGNHMATEADATASPVARVVLGYCPSCAYVRNVAFDESLIDPSGPTDMNLQHSAAFRAFTSDVVKDLVGRLSLRGRQVLEVGCAQGEFLRELCETAGCTGVGFDASYLGVEGADPSGATFHRRAAPPARELPSFDLVVSRFVLEHVPEPFELLAALRERAGDRAVAGHFQVPDAGYDLATAGWDVIYPHVSYFGAAALYRMAHRAGWRVEGTGPLFSGLIRHLDVSNDPSVWRSGAGGSPLEADLALARDKLLGELASFDRRHHAERSRWRSLIEEWSDAGHRPVLWGAGSRGVQLLNLADPDRRLAAVVDMNPAKWGRYLPATGHRVDEPDALRGMGTRVVIITNPVYRDEVARSLSELGVSAEVRVA